MTKKYYLMYLKEEYKDDVVSNADEFDNYLYAYTDDKKVYKLFKEFRDETKFKIVSKEIDEKDINYLAKYHQKKILHIRDICTTRDGTSIDFLKMSMTDYEYEYTNAEIAYDIYNTFSVDINPLVFKKEIIYSLGKLGIFRFTNLLPFSNFCEGVNLDDYTDISDYSKMAPDVLQKFIKLYKPLLKLKGE